MELEYDQAELKGKNLQDQINTCNLMLQSAEKYERLGEDEDFTAFLKDISDIADYHDKQVRFGLDSLWEKNVHEREEIFDQIFTHQTMKDMALAIVGRPKKAIDEAKTARGMLPDLEDQLRKTKEALV